VSYLIKQLVGVLAAPLMIAILIGAAAGAIRACGRRRMAAWLWVLAATVAYLGATVPIGDALLGPLEREYPPLTQSELSSATVGYIVVLGSGYSPRDSIPVTAALDEDGLVRIVEGIRLARRLSGVRLVVSGGAPPGRMPSALGYAKLARELGISERSLIVLAGSLDTGAEARAVASALDAAPFLLVTSAYHMPRAMRLMVRAGAHPIPAPTGHRVNKSAGREGRGFIPTSIGLRKTERALHEYIGLAALAAGFD
jgi:uncharacterized SAM-binding protein YcdF (DUF218 family)